MICGNGKMDGGAWRAGSRRGFTLTEMLVTIGLVVLMMLGVTRIFKSTTDTVGAGHAISTATRDSRAVQTVMGNDFRGAVTTDAPCLLIHSQQQFTFTNKNDELANNGYSADKDASGTSLLPTAYDPRNHRLDRIAFFSCGLFARQTGNDTPATFAASMTSNEAWVWYGHLWLPDNAGSWPTGGIASTSYPGFGTASTNPNNYYASQWALGRVAMLLVEPTPDNPSSPTKMQIFDKFGTPQMYVGRAGNPPGSSVAGVTTLSPLAVNSNATDGTTAAMDAATGIPSSRYDLAGTSMSGFKTILSNFIAASGGDWWSRLMMVDNYASFSYCRFKFNPYLSKPLTPASMAQVSPCLVRGCSQFIVEFAGDFDGDSLIDTDVVGGVQKIRWYGLPRRDATGALVADTLKNKGVNYDCERVSTPTDYVCAWGPDKPGAPMPKMIRIVYTLEDPSGRLAEGKTYEYVFELQ